VLTDPGEVVLAERGSRDDPEALFGKTLRGIRKLTKWLDAL